MEQDMKIDEGYERLESEQNGPSISLNFEVE